MATHAKETQKGQNFMNTHPYPPLPVQTFHGVHTRAGNNVHHRTRQLRDENFIEAALQGVQNAKLERLAVFSAVATVLDPDNFMADTITTTQGVITPTQIYVNPS